MCVSGSSGLGKKNRVRLLRLYGCIYFSTLAVIIDQIIMQKRWWVSLQYARARMLSVKTLRRAPTLFSSSPWLSLRFRLPAP